MSYRGIKRVLGEASLERKILILFGICLLMLIGGSFLWVNRVTEEVIRKNTRDRAKALAGDFMLRTHLKNVMFKNSPAEESLRKLFDDVSNYVQTDPYEATTIVLDDSIKRNQLNPVVATDRNEIERLNNISDAAMAKQAFYDRLMQSQEAATRKPDTDRNTNTKAETDNQGDANADANTNTSANTNANGNATPKNSTRDTATGANPSEPVNPDTSEVEDDFTFDQNYVYYAPVIFKTKCIICHDRIGDDEDFIRQLDSIDDAEDTAGLASLTFKRRQQLPPTFLRIKLQYAQSRSAVNRNRAILISVAIVTAVFAMAACWLIMRYVVMKPLRHLQDVSDEISRGQLDVRAELFTGDELESLSKSFNRMVRHLLDTQRELLGVNNDLDRKIDEQAQMNLKLYEMNQVKSEFLANMSHELRTPLNSIIGFSEILENAKGLEQKQVRFAKNIRNSGRLLLDLINDILDLAKLEAAKMEIRASEFSVNQLVRQLCDMVRPLAEKKNIALIFNADDDLPDLYQDKIKVRQILTNLVSNAIKFTPEGGRIYVSATRIKADQGQCVIELKVEDTGVGIAESDQEIIFGKFRQGPSAIGTDSLTREVSGTGLGLSIVKELCILLGGKISLASVVGKGSTFTATLPCNIQPIPNVGSEIDQSIEAMTKTNRVNFGRASLTPQPPSEDTIQ